MADTKRIVGYGIPGILLLVIASVLMLKSQRYFLGLLILIFGAAAILAFRAFGEDWIVKRKAAIKAVPLGDLEQKHAATEEKEKAVRADASFWLGIVRKVVDMLSSVSSPETRKPVFGDELAVIDKAIAEGTGQSLDNLYSKVVKDISLLEALVSTFEDEHRTIKEHTSAARKREHEIKDFLEELATAKKEHAKAVGREDREEKRVVLEQLEARMKTAMDADIADSGKLEVEAEKVSRLISRVNANMQKTSRLLPRVKSKFISSGDRSQKKYNEMIGRLDSLDKNNKELAGQAEEYRKLLYALRSELSVLREVIISAKHSELTAERLKFQAAAERADKEAADAGRLLGQLYKARFALDAKKSELEKEIAEKIKVMNTLSAQRKAWQDDLNNAFKAAAADEKVKDRVSFVLKKSIGEQTDALSSLMSLILTLNNSCNETDALLKRTKEELAAATRSKDALQEEKEALEKAKAKAEEQKAAAERESGKISRDAEEEKAKLKRASQEEAARIQANINGLNAKIAALKDIFGEASAQEQVIDRQLSPLAGQIAEASEAINILTAKVSGLKAEKDDKATKLASAEASYKGVLVEKDKFIGNLTARNSELERERRALLDSISTLDKDSRKIEGVISHMTSDIAGFVELQRTALEGIKGFDERVKRAEGLNTERGEKLAGLENALEQQREMYTKRVLFFLSLIATIKERIRNIDVEASSLERSSEAKDGYVRSLREQEGIIEADIKVLRERVREIRRIAEEKRSPSDEVEFRRLEAEITEKDGEIERLKEKAKDNSDAADKEAAYGGKMRGLLSHAKDQLEEAELGHKQVIAELEHDIQKRREELEEVGRSIDEREGRVARREATHASMQLELDELRQKIPEAKEIAEKNALLDQEFTLISQLLVDEAALAEAKQGLAELVRQRLISLIKERNDIDALFKAKGEEYAKETRDVDELKVKKKDAEHRVGELEEEVRRLKEEIKPPPDVEKLGLDLAQTRKEMADEEEKRKKAVKELEEARRNLEKSNKEIAAKEAELVKLRAEVERLTKELEEANLPLEEERQRSAKADKDSDAAVRAQQFADAKKKILSKIVEGRRFADDEPQKAINFTAEAVRLANKLKQQQLTKAEVFEVDRLISDATKIESYAERKLAALREPEHLRDTAEVLTPAVEEVTAAEAVPSGKVGVLIPFLCARVASGGKHKELSRKPASVAQADSPGNAKGSAVRMVVLDPSREGIIFGKSDDCDVVLRGDKDDVVVLSREHFKIAWDGKSYQLIPLPQKIPEYNRKTLSYARIRMYTPDGRVRKIGEGRPVSLSDGLEFFIDNAEMFCFVFRLFPIEDVQKVQKTVWSKAFVDFPASEEQVFGYLSLPGHAHLLDIDGEESTVMQAPIVLDRDEVGLGIAGSEELEKDGIGIKPDDAFFVVIKGTAYLCKERVPPLQAVIKREGEDYYIDNRSGLGTFVNYEKFMGKRRLMPGDIIHMGDNEPLFFIFNVKKFAADEHTIWSSITVSFKYVNFDVPELETDVGVLHVPKQATLSVTDLAGKTNVQDRLLLNRYVASFGSGEDNQVLLSCDDGFVDAQARPASSLIEDKHFAIKRDFLNAYSMTAMCAEGMRVLQKNGKEFILQKGMFYTPQDEDVIKLINSAEVFLVFNIEKMKINKSQY
ncbi:hypothetical protein HZB90_00985, partial [archaeon]|nr:hypothetical protein [archaeon]